MNHRDGIDAFDQQLQAALHSAPVPADLQAKLIARIREAATEQMASDPEALQLELERSNALQQVGNQPESELVAEPASPTSSTSVRKWLLRGSLLTAASLALIVCSVIWTRESSNANQLAEHCISELDEFENADWQRQTSLPESLQVFVQQNLSLLRPTVLIGDNSASAGQFGRDCKVWKLSDRRGELYLFMFDQSSSIGDLSSHLRVIQGSGRWSLAATQAAGQTIVVATRGDVRRYFMSVFA